MNCSHLFLFCFPFSLMKYKRKTESPSSDKKKTNIPPNNSQQKKIGFRLIHCGIRPNYFSLSCCCCFFTHQRRMKISFFQWTFLPADWDKVTSKVIKAERFPFHYSVPLPPSFPIGLGSLDGSFFLKNSTNTSTGCCRRRKRISSGSNNKRGGNAALSRRAPDFDKQRQVSRFLCLPFFVKGKKRTGM